MPISAAKNLEFWPKNQFFTIKNLTKNHLGSHPPSLPLSGDGLGARCVNWDNDKIFLRVSLAGGVPGGRNQEPEPSGCLPGDCFEI